MQLLDSCHAFDIDFLNAVNEQTNSLLECFEEFSRILYEPLQIQISIQYLNLYQLA